MGILINLVAKLSGASWAWGKMDGYKMYATGVLAVLGAVVGLGGELAPILASHNAAGLWAFLLHVNSDPAYIALLAGFATIAAAHKADKAAAAVAPVVVATVAVDPTPVVAPVVAPVVPQP